MCGRLVVEDPSQLVAGWSQTKLTLELDPLERFQRYNLAPTHLLLVLRQSESGREIAPARWGLVPPWAKDPAIGGKMFNARSETVAEKPAFRAAFRKRRCVVLASGFYEWKKLPRGKVPYRITTGEPMLFAGLWERWQSPEGEVVDSATILTRQASPPVSELHDREPVLLRTRDEAYDWIRPEVPDFADLHARMREPGPPLQLLEASARLNRVGNDGSQLLLPDVG